MRAPRPARSARSRLLFVAVFAVLAVMGFAAGMLLAFPFREQAPNAVVLAAGAALWWRLARTALPVDARPLVPAFAVQGGYLTWLVFGLLVLPGSLGLIAVAALSVGLFWLGRRPARPPAIYLLAVHGLAVALLLAEVLLSPSPGAVFPVFLAHATLRALGVFLTLRGLNVIWRRARRPAPRLP